MRHDIISDILSTIKNGVSFGKDEVITPASKLGLNLLLVMQKNGYIGKFEYIDDKKGGKFRVELKKKLNSCRSIRPRFSVKIGSFEKYEKRFLPSKGFGILIVSTPKGLMTHEEAKENGIGGKLIAFVY